MNTETAALDPAAVKAAHAAAELHRIGEFYSNHRIAEHTDTLINRIAVLEAALIPAADGAKRFLVRDESGRGGTTHATVEQLVEDFAEDYDDAHDVFRLLAAPSAVRLALLGREGETTEPFIDVVDALEVGDELRLDGATVIIRVK